MARADVSSLARRANHRPGPNGSRTAAHPAEFDGSTDMTELISASSPAGVDDLPLPARTDFIPARPGPVGGPLRLNLLVRWAFYLSIFSIPFSHLYLPGTGGRVGVLRVVQLVISYAVFCLKKKNLRLVPT